MVPNNKLGAAIDQYNWGLLRTLSGDARSIPERLCGLISSSSEVDVKHWYWLLENHIVVSGGVFESALPSINVLMTALETCSMSRLAKGYTYELIYQIVNGCSDIEAIRRGNGSIASECKEYVKLHINTLIMNSSHDTDELLQLIKARVLHSPEH